MSDMPDIPQRWLDLFALIPGYDPVATAAPGDWFDVAKADKVVAFFPAFLTHVEGERAGQPFTLEPWQAAHVGCAFGWKRADGTRRYREVFDYEPRKMGKTTKLAGLVNLVALTDGEEGAQIYSAAAEREQAALIYRPAKIMLENSKQLRGSVKFYTTFKSIEYPHGVTYKAISADAKSKHGFNAHFVIVDELHAQPDRELVDVLVTSMGTRRQPLIWFITTADYDRPSICNEKHEYACKVRDGIIDDHGFLPIIYEAPRDANWKDENVWAAVNPNLGVSVKWDFLRAECKRACEVPAFENTFRRLYLNQRTEQAERVIPMAQWDAAPGIVLDTLINRDCYGGLDIGATSDFTAFTLLFPHDDAEEIEIPVDLEKPAETRTVMRRSYSLRCWFWLPETPVRRDQRMQAQIDAWIKAGYIRVTPGNVVDYDQVLADIIEIVEPYDMREVAFDRGFQGGQMGTNLQKHFGDRVIAFPQGILSMNAPFREILELLAVGRIHHDKNPVMRWMVSNVTAERRGGLMKPSKEKSPEKIDGVSALTMSMGRGVLADANVWSGNVLA